ncbi:lethal (3) 80Fj [Amblyomma americanum]
MAGVEVPSVFKDLPVKVQTSKLVTRKDIFFQLEEAAKSGSLTEPIVRGLCQVLRLTLSRYNGSTSRHLVEQFVGSLLAAHPSSAGYLIATILDVSREHKSLFITKNLARTCLTAFSWSCKVAHQVLVNQGDLKPEKIRDLVEAQTNLLLSVSSACNATLNKKAKRKINYLWRQVSTNSYVEVLSSLEPSCAVLLTWCFLIAYLDAQKQRDVIHSHKAKFLEVFKTVVLMSKTPPPTHVLEHSRCLLRHATHEDFKEQLMPALQKAMLRNPEIIMESVAHVLQGVSLELSPYLGDLGKSLAQNLIAKDESCRQGAVVALRNLAHQCGSQEALEALIKHLVGVLNGSEGKLTTTEQRLSVLTSIGEVSCHVVNGASHVQQLSEVALKHLLTVLKAEVHEGTLLLTLKMMSKWCARFTQEPPAFLLTGFKEGMEHKTATSAVRYGHLQCMISAFHGMPDCNQVEPVLGLVLKAVERALAQPSQPGPVCEGLAAACLLFRLQPAGSPSENKIKSMVTQLLDPEKQPFFAEKFLQAASEDTYLLVLQLITRMILDYPDSCFANLKPFVVPLLKALSHTSHPVRQSAQNTVRKLVSVLSGTSLACFLLREFSGFVDGHIKEKAEESGPAEAKVLAEALVAICSGSNLDAKDTEELALESLLPAHHPIFAAHHSNLWLRIVDLLKLDRKAPLDPQQALPPLLSKSTVTPNVKGAITTLTTVLPGPVMSAVIADVLTALQRTELRLVTVEEYAIYSTPEGVLFNKGILSNVVEATTESKNIKRESKVYSYKEQMEEIELKKELEAKKKTKVQEPELTKKQKEVLDAQLQKEHVVRLRVRELANSVERAMSLLDAVMAAPSSTVCVYGAPLYPQLVQALTALFSSRLAAPIVVPAYLRLKDVLFAPDLAHFAASVAYLALRLAYPCCEVDPRWTEESLEACMQRVMARLHDLACAPTNARRLPTPAFCFTFPMLRLLLSSPNTNDTLLTQCLQVLSAHSVMRCTRPFSLENPKNLPVEKILETVVGLLGRTTGRIQRLAQKVAVDVCFSISGLEGCSRAEVAEVKVLLGALYSPELVVRETALQCLLMLQLVVPTHETDPVNSLELAARVWVARFDAKDEIKALAEKLWRELKLEPEPALCARLLSDVGHPQAEIRSTAALALKSLLQAFPDRLHEVLLQLMDAYREHLQRPEPVRDSFGRVIMERPPDVWEPRSGVGLALGQLAPLVPPAAVSELMEFYVHEALSEPHPVVHKALLDAATALVDFHGNSKVNTLLPLFERFLDDAPRDQSYDQVRQSVVILMGTLARHLDKDDQKVKPIVNRLIDTLATPSQQVQEAVATCLPPLIPAIKDEAPALVQKLLTQLLNSEQYGERRGAAYGLAGLVRGLGILSLKQLDIMNTLTEAVQDKKNARRKEGALLAFEMLCSVLGRLFEPYVVHVLPHLLLCFGDSNQYVREATDNTAKAVMSKLTAHGVKLTLPSLLAGLENDLWRTKSGSVELLGAMAFCAPKQLSSCLPSIVPKLIEVLSDSHIKVQRAGAQALKHIGSVIKNPEIQAIVPVLLDALQDPAEKTSDCLATLLNTKFVHFIDAPSLALIMPVVQRAFQDRSTETKKMAAQIIGNMYSLTDHKDLAPYLPAIIPGLKQSLLDPVPEVRSVSSRALGAMIKGMGETCFEDLIPWLMQTLTSESSPVDRSGAAQGLSEVLGGLGVEKLQTLMPEIISTAERTDIAPHVKDGYIMMFIYLPGVFQKEFTPYISQIINPILKALADENEYVRETALRAGQRMVNMYADTAMTLLLPQLEKGLFDDNWRIRYSSVQLLGDLLYKISGVTGKMSTETAHEDDNFGTEQSHKAIMIALGEERRNRVLAGLYMGRLDTSLMVRQASLHVWKVVVTNTPRTLREILPTLFSLLLGFLASSSYDKQQVAARTLGDLVRKLGERVLPEIVPILEQGLDSELPDQRQGVCVGLSEILASTSRDMVLTFLDSLVPTVRRALCDPLREVRVAAARTFDNLHSTVGSRALDDILSPLLMQLGQGDSELAEHTLDGLRQVMAIKSRVVLPYLIPQLTTPPVNTKALSHLSAVAGESLSRHLPKILPALLTAFSASLDTPKQQEELEHCQAVVLSVADEAGVQTVVEQLLAGARQPNQRRAAVALLCAFCAHARAPLTPHVPQLLRELLRLFTDTDRHVLQLAGEALAAVTKTLDTNQQIEYVTDVRQAIRFAASDLKGQEYLPGFCQEKGISPILPIFREAILIGVPELKEQAAQGLGEVIRLTDAASLRQSVISITGPLIRILGDRFSFSVKVAVLETLALLLAKVGVQLKPFLPQLQTTFLKALNDGNRQVRLKAAVALSHLIVIHTRCDPVFQELHNSVKGQDDPTVRETMLYALHRVVAVAGHKMSDLMRRSVTASVSAYLSSSEDGCRTAAAGCLGSLCRWLPPDELAVFAREHLLSDDPSEDWTLRHGCSVTLSVALKQAPERILTDDWRDRVVKTLIKYMTADRVPIVFGGVRGTGHCLRHMLTNSEELPQVLLTTFSKCLNHTSNEVKQLVAQTVQWLSRCLNGAQPVPAQLLRSLVPQLVNGTKEKNTMVRANSEYALVALLRLRASTEGLEDCLAVLDPGAKESLQDVYNKVLRKVASHPEPKEEDLDDGILS